MFCSLVNLALLFSAMTATPQPQSWQVDYGKALTEARNKQRPLVVLLDIPAKKAIDSSVSNQPKPTAELQTQAKLLKSYQRCHVDASTKYGKKVAKIFDVKKFPFRVIIDKTGSNILFKKSGPISAVEWSEKLALYQKGVRVQQEILQTSFFRPDGTLDAADKNIVAP